MKSEQVMRCAICLHLPPGDTIIHAASPAITIISGLAVCANHIDWTILPLHIEEKIYKYHGVEHS